MKFNRLLVTDAIVYYFSLIAPMAIYVAVFGFYFANNDSSSISGTLQHILYYSKFFWFTGFLVVVANILGLFIYGSPRRRELSMNVGYDLGGGWNPEKRLIVSYVSRGDNFKALERSISRSAKVLSRLGVEYMIDVVTDKEVASKVQKELNTHFHVVPDAYATGNDTKYKARAVHFMVEQRNHPSHHSVAHPDVWVLHLDEESIVTESSVYGIHSFINDEKNARRIGQGEIKYNAHKYANNLFIAAADSIRTGDDLGRFRFQYKLLNRPLFGMHGSYVLVPNALEREIGFDLSPKQSITEDAYFAFKAFDKGYQFGWVEGYVREQSPFTAKDILKQRRRWFNGLMYLSFDRDITLKTRFFLMINMVLWLVAWVGPIITVVNLLAGGGYFPLPFAIAAAVLQGGYASIYLIGAHRNMLDTKFSFGKKLYLYIATFVLTPFANIIEGLAVLYAIVSPVKGFHVVQKN